MPWGRTEANNIPFRSIGWYMNGTAITADGSKYTTTSSYSLTSSETSSTLVISSLEEGDEADYNCFAIYDSNEVESDELSLLIQCTF